MCEPSHSVIQFKDHDDDDDSLSAQGGGFHRTTILGKLMGYAKKFKDWLHVSRMGLGHSETVGKILSSVSRWNYDLVMTRYEGHWWNRQVKVDGGYCVPSYDQSYALQAATDYCRAVCTGNLSLLRQFLEASLTKTERPMAYLDAFRMLLNEKGKASLEKDAKKKMKKNLALLCRDFGQPESKQRQQATNFLLGYTRKRHLLVPEWADDNNLWTP
jgi:hypothetical protein